MVDARTRRVVRQRIMRVLILELRLAAAEWLVEMAMNLMPAGEEQSIYAGCLIEYIKQIQDRRFRGDASNQS